MSETESKQQSRRKKTDEPAETAAPEHYLGKVINAPTSPNAGGFENKVVPPPNAPVDKTAGANATMAAHVFETRVTQEQGTH